MEVYLDLVVILNFVVDLLLLVGTNRLAGFPNRWRGILGASVLGGCYSGACVLRELRFLGGGFWRTVFLVLMGVLAFGWNRSFFRRCGLFVLLTMTLGGVALAIGRPNASTLILGGVGLWLLCRVGFGDGIGNREYVTVTLARGEQQCTVIALRDSGNTLRDPVTGEQVLVIAGDIAARLTGLTLDDLKSPLETLTRNPGMGLRLIPFHAVGNQGGALADLLRPQTLDEVYGQEHILGENGILRRLVESGKIPNMVFYGPSGTGKTTVANIIAKQTNRTLYKLNATTASTSDIKDIVAQLDTFMAPNGVLLYLDEIQSFNKKQQQSLLEHIENGKITLIASTTENPYFYVFNAILSRSTVFEFKQISSEAALKAVKRAVAHMEQRTALHALPEEGALEYIASACGGDIRKALNAVEVLFSAGRPVGEQLTLTLADAKMVTQKSAMRADRDGDNHYDLLSALQKSIRGSDPDAACHYLARLLEVGQMQSACRRLMVIAAEDVGLAYPMIIPIVNACVDMALKLGMPEARIPLGDAAILMATSPKSNSGHIALDAALADIRQGKTGDFPRHLQNVHADSYTMEREQGYRYPHDYPNHWVEQQYLPNELVGKRYYEYGPNKLEQSAKQYWDAVKKK